MARAMWSDMLMAVPVRASLCKCRSVYFPLIFAFIFVELINPDYGLSRNFRDQFDFDACAQRDLRHAERRTRVLALITEDFAE